MAVYRRIVICREGLYYLLVAGAVLIGAVSRQLNLLMLLGTVLLGPFVFSLLYGRLALRRFTSERKLPASLRADERLFVDVSVTNLRRWLSIWAIEVRDTLRRQNTAPRGEEPAHVSVCFSAIGARQTKRISYEGQLPERGRYRFGPLRVSTRFPLGLVRHSILIDQVQELLVHPKLGCLSRDWSRVVHQEVTGNRSMHKRGLLEAEFFGLRDWRPGDNSRWIHWRTTARRGVLVVRQFEQRRSQDLAVLLDLWQPSVPADEHLEIVEKAVSFVATLVAEACRQPGRHFALSLAAGETVHRAGTASSLFFAEQMDMLAVVGAHSEAEFPAALGRALTTIAPSTPTLLISTRDVDWEAFRRAAAQVDACLEGRALQAINVARDDELARCFHA